MYDVKRIKSKDEIANANLFSIDHFQWTCVKQPKAYGRMGFIEDEGLYVCLTCEEENPKRTVTEDRVNVCQDSVMEVFFAFPDEGKKPEDDKMYLNFETNANGALYAKKGVGRKGREFLSEDLYKKCNCQAKIEDDRWIVTMLIPKELLEEIGAWEKVSQGNVFYCNFYKMSENPEMEHYASFHPLNSETPNFHLPSSFAEARVQ